MSSKNVQSEQSEQSEQSATVAEKLKSFNIRCTMYKTVDGKRTRIASFRPNIMMGSDPADVMLQTIAENVPTVESVDVISPSLIDVHVDAEISTRIAWIRSGKESCCWTCGSNRENARFDCDGECVKFLTDGPRKRASKLDENAILAKLQSAARK